MPNIAIEECLVKHLNLFVIILLLITLSAASSSASTVKPISQPPDSIFAPTSAPASFDYCDAIHAEYPGMVKVNGLYYAYYSGYGCSWRIHYATSSDGIHFAKHGLISLSDGWSHQQAFPFVLYEDGGFKLYYGGGLPYQIGYATSSDGVNFTAQSHPVLSYGPSNSWDSSEVVRPSIVEVISPSLRLRQSLSVTTDTNRLYMMYYNGFGSNDSAIGLAYSSDGLTWQPYAANPIVTSTTGIYTSFAITQSGTTYLYYHTENAIYLTLSTDGVNFTSYSPNPILSPSTVNGWDAGLVYGVFVRQADDGSYVMYYNGIAAANGSYGMVGIATSADLIHFTPRADNPAITVGNTPANFSAAANSDGSISASWHDVVSDTQSYRLYYGNQSGTYSDSFDVTGVESATFTPSSGGDYYLTVIATTNGHAGYPAAERMVHVLGPTPTPPPSVTPLPCVSPFSDIEGNVFATAINYLYCNRVINGVDGTHYAPSATVTRGQFAKIAVLGFGLPLSTPATPTFSDVPASYYAYAYIESGYTHGILSGFDQQSCRAAALIYPCYLPNQAISRGQLSKLVVTAAGYPLYTPSDGPSFSDVPPNNVFYAAIETAYQRGIISGYPDHTFRPATPVRRDEMAQIVYTAIANW